MAKAVLFAVGTVEGYIVRCLFYGITFFVKKADGVFRNFGKLIIFKTVNIFALYA